MMEDQQLLRAAFDDCGGAAVQPMVLKMKLRDRGMSDSTVDDYITAAVDFGALLLTENGNYRMNPERV